MHGGFKVRWMTSIQLRSDWISAIKYTAPPTSVEDASGSARFQSSQTTAARWEKCEPRCSSGCEHGSPESVPFSSAAASLVGSTPRRVLLAAHHEAIDISDIERY
jgi:hypothetical protein